MQNNFEAPVFFQNGLLVQQSNVGLVLTSLKTNRTLSKKSTPKAKSIKNFIFVSRQLH